MDTTINYINCPLSIEGQMLGEDVEAERVAVLVPTDHPLVMKIIAVTDFYGTFPATGFLDLELLQNKSDCWMINGFLQTCPPGRDHMLRSMLERWSREGIVKFARWCRNRAIEYAWEADGPNSYGTINRANEATAEARLAANTDTFDYAVECASLACKYAGYAASEVTRNIHGYQRQWMESWDWLCKHDKKYRKDAES